MGGNRASLRPLVLAAIVGAAQAKFSSGSFHLDAGDFEHGPEYEIAKFSFLEGMAHINGKVRYKTADSNWMTSPALYLFNDDAWDAWPDHAQPHVRADERGELLPHRWWKRRLGARAHDANFHARSCEAQSLPAVRQRQREGERAGQQRDRGVLRVQRRSGRQGQRASGGGAPAPRRRPRRCQSRRGPRRRHARGDGAAPQDASQSVDVIRIQIRRRLGQRQALRCWIIHKNGRREERPGPPEVF